MYESHQVTDSIRDCPRRFDSVRLASDVFHKEYREAINTKEAQTRFTYRNHYSPSLNKCFFLEMSYGFHNTPIYSDKMYRLYDVNENSQYGVFYRRSDMTAPMACQVGDKICWSEDEWETLISFYMGDRQDVNVP